LLPEQLEELLNNLKRGEAVTVLPHDALLTTQQAAQILNVSRPYLYRLIEDQSVPVVCYAELSRSTC
jgi:hypothetical protein